ncbi:MAG: YifB family Mg chelatase-like AAA ATPase [Steroidobacteraceae bacterium]
MAIATVLSRAQFGMEAPLVRVEVDIGNGLPAFGIVGLPEVVVKESRDRVRAAITNSRFEFPAGRVIVNLAPADLPKEGGRFDLPIAIGILVAAGQLPGTLLDHCELYGELSLSGELRSAKGVLPAAVAAQRAGHLLVLPQGNAEEAGMVSNGRIAAAAHLLEVCAHLSGDRALPMLATSACAISSARGPDLADVKGQPLARRALEIAAAGSHSLLFVGPPGSGKSMLAQRLPGLLPPLSEDEALEVAAIRSVIGQPVNLDEWRVRPYRSPHHTASAIALVGGGKHPRPGEVSLAHHGVLFLDELPEFDRRVLEVLREPLEAGTIAVSRAARQAEFPARFQLIAAMNPCPCGYRGDTAGRCRCTADQVQRYRHRLSGPLLDRLDMQLEVPRVETALLSESKVKGESSERVAERVQAARVIQLQRQGALNAHLDVAGIEAHCKVEVAELRVLERAIQHFQLSARAYHRILKVARTIADLATAERVLGVHLREAISLRGLERARAL